MTDARNLKALQEAFAAALAGGDEGGLAARLAGEAGRAARGAAIYRRAVQANATAALKSAYPVIARLVGEDFFEEAARVHLQTSPSRCGDLNRFGEAFPAFLGTYPHAAPWPFLPDVARLEWAWHEALTAGDAAPLDIAALARVPAEGQATLRFEVHPSVRLVRSPWPVIAIWEANQPESDGTLEREAEPEQALVWREAQRVRIARLATPEALFLSRLMDAMTLEAAADVPGEWDLTACLRRFAAHGVLCGFRP